MISYKQLQNIGMSILILGLINLYNILKTGVIMNIPQENSLFSVESYNILIAIFITIILSIIINLSSLKTNITNMKIRSKSEINKEKFSLRINTLEYNLLLGLGLIGLIILIISKEILGLYLGLELYSFTIYILILVKETPLIRRISIIYLILSSLMSALILFSFSFLYKYTGSLNIEIIRNILINKIESLNTRNEEIEKIIYLIIIALFFKLGTGPFIYWVVRVYSELEKRILWYQLTIPKLIFFIILLKFLSLTSSNYYISYTIYIIAIISIIIGTIGGLFQNKDNMLLSYSSILNIGYLLLSLSFLYILNIDISLFQNILEHTQLWILIQFFIIYIINLLGLFSILYLFSRSSFVFNLRSFFLYPFYFISFLIIILSFIGIPPLSGFISKFYLFYTLMTYPKLTILTIIIFILSTLISSFFYFKFLFASSFTSSDDHLFLPNLHIHNFGVILLSFSTLFSILYSFYFSSLIPFFSF